MGLVLWERHTSIVVKIGGRMDEASHQADALEAVEDTAKQG